MANTKHTKTNTADFTIRLMGGRYKVFDKQGKFRVGFTTQADAQKYIDDHTKAKKPVGYILTPAT